MSKAGRALVVGLLLVGLSSPAAATVWEVKAGVACPGAGTLASPFCTIGQAAAVAVAGDTVNVAGGDYREQVTPPASGSPGLPITYHAKATNVRVLGTNSLSGAALWTLSSGTTFVASYDPPTNPRQVWRDNVPLTESTAGANAVPLNGFFYDSIGKALYVNVGGANPGKRHTVEAGARSFGFDVTGRTDLVIEGFEVRGQNTNGIRVRSSANIVVRGNRVLRARSFGIVAEGTDTPTVTSTGPIEISGNEVFENGSAGIRFRTHVTLATVRNNVSHHNQDHGLLAGATTASVFSANEFFENAKPGGQFTTGMRIDTDSDGNRIERNLSHDNQDSGFQVSSGADDNVLVRNISFSNGDHGYDVRECNGARLISNTAHANANDGFSVEGDVTNAYLRNNIAVENGILTGGNDLWVDATSTVGFSSDYDVFWHSTGTYTVEYGGAVYHTLADFAAATGHEAQGTGANPNFTDPAAGDFHPGLGPATDAADASATDFQALDFDGIAPIDLAGVPNTGAGVPDFADRGALERLDAAPVAALTVTPKKARLGQLVTADGSASKDDAGIVSYHFEWGDGTSTTQAGPVATHAYTTKGKKKVRLTVTDGVNQTATTEKTITVG